MQEYLAELLKVAREHVEKTMRIQKFSFCKPQFEENLENDSSAVWFWKYVGTQITERDIKLLAIGNKHCLSAMIQPLAEAISSSLKPGCILIAKHANDESNKLGIGTALNLSNGLPLRLDVYPTMHAIGLSLSCRWRVEGGTEFVDNCLDCGSKLMLSEENDQLCGYCLEGECGKIGRKFNIASDGSMKKVHPFNPEFKTKLKESAEEITDAKRLDAALRELQ